MSEQSTILPWFDDVLSFMQDGPLARWAEVLPQQLNEILHEKEHN